MTLKSFFRELPYASVSDIASYHGQFNNVINNSLPTKKYLDKPSSLYDLDLFSFEHPKRHKLHWIWFVSW